jgi:hypothetical protein
MRRAIPLREPLAHATTTGAVRGISPMRRPSSPTGMFTVPGTLPEANSAGERTSTNVAPARRSSGSIATTRRAAKNL